MQRRPKKQAMKRKRQKREPNLAKKTSYRPAVYEEELKAATDTINEALKIPIIIASLEYTKKAAVCKSK
jgi:hypothetical protein